MSTVVYLRFIVDVESQLASFQVEEDSDGGADIDPAVGTIAVDVVVQEPGALMIDVHRPALVIFPCDGAPEENVYASRSATV